MMTQKMKMFSMPMAILSKVAVLLAVYGAFTKNDLWLAPTQWLLVAIILMVYAIYTKGGGDGCGCGGGSKLA